MKTLLVATCLWHTLLVHHYRDQDKDLRKYVDLINKPKIGQRVHDNGLIWRVKTVEKGKGCK